MSAWMLRWCCWLAKIETGIITGAFFTYTTECNRLN